MKALKYGIKNSIFEIIYFILNVLTNFIIRKLLIENINIEIIGLNQILTQIISTISLIEFGIGNIMLFYLYPSLKKKAENAVNDIVCTFEKKYKLIALSLLIIGITFIPLLKYFINDFTLPINYVLIYLIILLQNVFTLLISYKIYLLQADQKNYLYLKVMIIFKIMYLLLAFITIKFISNSYLYFIVYSTCEVLTYYAISKLVDKKYHIKKQKQDVINEFYDIEIIRHIKSTGVSKIFGELNKSLDIFVLSFFSTGYTLGLYSNYYTIFSSIYWIILKIFDSFKAGIAKLLNASCDEQIYNIFELLCLSSYVISLFTSIIFYLSVDIFINIWIGKEYLLPKPIPLLLAMQLFIFIYRIALWQTVNIKGWFNICKISDLVGIIINLVLSIVLYFYLEISGIIVATIISQIVQLIIEIYFILKKLKKISIRSITEKLLLVSLYIGVMILLMNKSYLSIFISFVVLLYLFFIFKRRCIYVFSSKKNI